LPIEPKPIMTIGPVMRPCTGQTFISGLSFCGSLAGKALKR
jgi:hypothetical protein